MFILGKLLHELYIDQGSVTVTFRYPITIIILSMKQRLISFIKAIGISDAFIGLKNISTIIFGNKRMVLFYRLFKYEITSIY